jgi:hypothetical protein
MFIKQDAKKVIQRQEHAAESPSKNAQKAPTTKIKQPRT